ncbi:MAG: class I SAM-dependent methyltransferase [Spirillospora sp.]
MVVDTAIMVREFVRAPVRTGAIAPGSARLASVAAPVPGGEPVVVEFGPGTGAITSVIQRRLDGRGTHIAIDANPRLAALVARRWGPVFSVHDDAVNLRAVLERQGVERADLIVSSLPWASFSAGVQDRLLDAVVDGLADGGIFTTYAYAHARVLPSAVRFRRRLPMYFEEVRTSPVVWGNFPPAVVYYARRAGFSARSSRREG